MRFGFKNVISTGDGEDTFQIPFFVLVTFIVSVLINSIKDHKTSSGYCPAQKSRWEKVWVDQNLQLLLYSVAYYAAFKLYKQFFWSWISLFFIFMLYLCLKWVFTLFFVPYESFVNYYSDVQIFLRFLSNLLSLKVYWIHWLSAL